MSVGTPQEWGALGYQALVAKYGEHRINQWRRKGGRPRNRTLAEIQAGHHRGNPETTRAGRRSATTVRAVK